MAEQSGLAISQSDLQDRSLFRLNSVLNTLAGQIDSLQTSVKQVKSVGAGPGAGQQIFYGTHALRPAAASVTAGGLYYETDRTSWYQNRAGAWIWVGGQYYLTQAGIGALGATLGSSDVGFLISVTDYAHELVWNGVAWGWGPGEGGSGQIELFLVAPAGNGWQLCDGSAGVAYLKPDGTTATLTVPNFTHGSPAYLKAGASVVSYVGASLPTMGVPSSTSFVTGPGAAIVGSNVHTHTVSLAGGDPIPNMVCLAYFRR